MAADANRSVTHEDVESLAEKLEAFGAGLSEGERAVLTRVISTAAVATEQAEEVQGYGVGFSNALALNLARGSSFNGSALIPSQTPVINPGSLCAKDEELFQGFNLKR